MRCLKIRQAELAFNIHSLIMAMIAILVVTVNDPNMRCTMCILICFFLVVCNRPCPFSQNQDVVSFTSSVAHLAVSVFIQSVEYLTLHSTDNNNIAYGENHALPFMSLHASVCDLLLSIRAWLLFPWRKNSSKTWLLLDHLICSSQIVGAQHTYSETDYNKNDSFWIILEDQCVAQMTARNFILWGLYAGAGNMNSDH
jgi:hypothetical protein